MAIELLILILWIVCVILTLALIFDVSFGVIIGWFSRAYERSGTSEKVRTGTLMIMGSDSVRVGSHLLTSILPPMEPGPHARSTKNPVTELEKILEDGSTHRLILSSIRRHVEHRCTSCSRIRTHNVVLVDCDHYSDLYALTRDKKMDLAHVNPHTTTNIAHSFRHHTITLELPLLLSKQQKGSISIGQRTLTLGRAAYIEQDTTLYENDTDSHMIVLRTYL